MFLSVLICSILSIKGALSLLLRELTNQAKGLDVEILVDLDNREKTIAQKRNDLLDKATGEMLVFVDDDDMVSNDYLKTILSASNLGVDYIGYKIKTTINGDFIKPTYHSISFPRSWDDELGYYNNISHINPIKSSIAKQFRFPESEYGEDGLWNELVFKSGLVKTEYYIDKFMYFYQYEYMQSMANKATMRENELRQPSLDTVSFDHSLVNFVNKKI